MIVGFVCLHYGTDYLGYAIKSAYDCVDKIFIAYSSKSSHGQDTKLKCPDSRNDLYNAAHQFGDPDNKIVWADGQWKNEGDHRHEVFRKFPDANLVFVVDSDEIWHRDELSNAIDFCMKTEARNFKQKLVTPWRSFNWLCRDEMMPDRFYRPDKQGIAYIPSEIAIYYHMGYAIPEKLMQYKMSCHGHLNELKNGWFSNTFMKWPNIRDNLHPTCEGMWNVEPFDKQKLPGVLHNHPFWDIEIIR